MIRLTAQHRDPSGAVRTLFIYDRELLVYQSNKVLCTDDFYRIKHEGDINDPFKRIISANCSFTIFLKHHNYTVEEQTEVQLFFNDLINSHEGRFYIKCQYGETLEEIETEFLGKIIPDIGELTLDIWQTVQLTAIDGMSGLKDVEYRPTGYSDLLPEYAIGSKSFVEHFVDILKRNDVVNFFQDEIAAFNTVFITTSGFWTESQSVSGDIFKQVRIRNIYFEQVSPSFRKYKSCYDVLDDLLKGFVARVIYASGKYHIEQLPYQDNLTLVRYGYKYNGDVMTGTTYGNKTTINYTTNDNMKALPYPSKRWLPPFKAVELSGTNVLTNYINGLNIFATYPGYDGNDTFNYEYIIATGKRLIGQWQFNFTRFPSLGGSLGDSKVLTFTLRFKIQIGSYYVRKTTAIQLIPDNVVPYFTDQFGNYPNLEWSLTDSTITMYWYKSVGTETFTMDEDLDYWLSWLTNTSLIFTTNEIQEDEEMTITVVDFVVKDQDDNVIGTNPYPAASLKATSRLIIANSENDLYEKPDNLTIYEVGDIKNTLIYKTELSYYDSSSLDFKQLLIKPISIYVLPNYPTVEWTDPDATITAPIQKLMMQTILSMRQKPAELFKMDFIFLDDDIFRMDMRVAIDDELYIPLDLEIGGGNGVYKVTLLKVFKDFDGINIIDTGEPEISIPFPMPDGGLNSRTTNGNGSIMYFEEWSNVSVNYITVSGLQGMVNVNDDYQTKTKNHLFINGVRQKYTPDDDPLEIRSFKFDVPNERIYFGKGSGNVKHIEFITYY